MTFAAVMVIALAFLAVVVLGLFEVAQILAEGGPKLFFWPKLNHGYEVAPVIRLAVAPWALLLFGLGGNGACILLFGHDLMGRRTIATYRGWPRQSSHRDDPSGGLSAQRDRGGTGVHLLLAAGFALCSLQLTMLGPGRRPALPFLLWSLNGIRARSRRSAIG